MTVDVGRLRLLVEVARHGSMTGAANALAYTPSAISQQIRQLEIEAGQPVLERHPARGQPHRRRCRRWSSTPR